MFSIYGGKTEFSQWDLDQLVTNPCMKDGDSAVFRACGKVYATQAYTKNGEVVADVPNFLLQKPCQITVDLGWGLDSHMDCRTVFDVKAKEKPDDYECDHNIPGSADGNGSTNGSSQPTKELMYEWNFSAEDGVMEFVESVEDDLTWLTNKSDDIGWEMVFDFYQIRYAYDENGAEVLVPIFDFYKTTIGTDGSQSNGYFKNFLGENHDVLAVNFGAYGAITFDGTEVYNAVCGVVTNGFRYSFEDGYNVFHSDSEIIDGGGTFSFFADNNGVFKSIKIYKITR